MAHLKKSGTVVYIDVPCDELERRINNITTRGIASEKGQTLKDIFNERAPLYKKYADLTIITGNCTLEESVSRLVHLLLDGNFIKL